MIPSDCKRLAEVDFPIAVVSKHAAREKSIRHGHPSTLHLWWARRPLAACRAMLMALLLPDPADPNCPKEFLDAARAALASFAGAPRGWSQRGKSGEGLREILLKFIADFANWDVASDSNYVKTARELVRAAHGDEPPLVVDPFAGGGSIPLEALRVGCDAFASDLNPVACLILKAVLEDIPRCGSGLADDLRQAGAELKIAAEKELRQFYPTDPDGARPIAYLWARTVICETPKCGAEIPLVRSFWLSRKASRKRALRYRVARPRGESPRIDLEVFQPKNDKEVPAGTVSRAKARCPACEVVLAPERVRAQLYAQRGGADAVFNGRGERSGGARMLVVVTLRDDCDGRQYRLPTPADYRAVWKTRKRLRDIESARLANGLSAVPDEPTPTGGGSGAGRAFSVQKYGMLTWGDLFTARQKVALATLAAALPSSNVEARVAEVLALCISRLAARNSSLCLWLSQGDQETVWTTFGRNALPIVWDFAEAVPLSESTGSLSDSIEVAGTAIRDYPTEVRESARVQLADAAEAYPLPDEASSVWFTDPPYYDAIPYAELSDFFFAWLKRMLPGQTSFIRDPFDPLNPLTPKIREAVQDEMKRDNGHIKNREWFELKMARAFAEGRRVLREDGVGSIVFAHKTTEGWEALLSGVIQGGLTITGSWPIATERKGRPRAHQSAALATSIHLACRPRPYDAPVGEWSDVARELPTRIADWMERLSAEGVRGADLVFACIGPAMEVYSRYSRVEDAEGRDIPLGGDPEASRPHQRGFLAYVWEMVGRAALNQVLGTGRMRPDDSAAGALEEDARLTALFLWTLQSTATANDDAVAVNDVPIDDDETMEDEDAPPSKKKGLTLIYDVARRFAQPLGIHLDQWDGRIIEIDKGVVRLLPVTARAEQLFGERGADAVAHTIETAGRRGGTSGVFDFMRDAAEASRADRHRGRKPRHQPVAATGGDLDIHTATTLDRVHAAMLLQRAGRATALRAFLNNEQERGPEFLRLANALSALYPKDSEEKRLLDAMLLVVPR